MSEPHPCIAPPTAREKLQALSQALTSLATRMRDSHSAADDFARLVARAESISAQAWRVNTSKWMVTETAGTLADQLVAFAREVATASSRASLETSRNTAVTDALLQHAQRISSIAETQTEAAVEPELRAELQPLEATLSALHTRMQSESTVARDAAALSARAAGLAATALRLRGGGRAAEIAAVEIHTALRDFVDDAAAISSRMSTNSTTLSKTATLMAQRTGDLSARTPRVPAGIVWTGVGGRS